MAASWPALALCAGTLAIGTTIGGRGIKGALTVMLGASITLLAMWTALRFDHARATSHWSGYATDGLASAAMGIVGVVAMLPRHLGFAFDPVRGAIKQLPSSLDNEVRALCTRTVAIWNDIDDKLDDSDPGQGARPRSRVEDARGRDQEQRGPTARSPATKSSVVAWKTSTSGSPRRPTTKCGRNTKRRAPALSDQRTYRDRIRQNRERLVARLHNHLAALEKFQLAVGIATAASQQLSDLSRDVAASGEALGEVGEA